MRRGRAVWLARDARRRLDLIESAAIAVERGGFKRVGVVATAATVGAGSYGRTIRARVGGIDVVEVPAPALVPLVEAGTTEGEIPRSTVAEVCGHLPLDLDVFVFGCTHYPVLESHFRAVLGDGITLIDPAFMQAERTAELLGNRANGSGSTEYTTSGDETTFLANVAHFIRAGLSDDAARGGLLVMSQGKLRLCLAAMASIPLVVIASTPSPDDDSRERRSDNDRSMRRHASEDAGWVRIVG